MKKKNVLLITIDCLRADHVSCLGYKKKTTPNIDKLAKEGCLFTCAVSNGSSTYSSFPSIFTSTYALMFTSYPKLSDKTKTLAEILKENNFKTAGFNSNPFLSRKYGYQRGFDFFGDKVTYGIEKQEKLKSKRAKKRLIDIIKRNEVIFDLVKKAYAPVKNFRKKFLKKFTATIYLPYEPAKAINKKFFSWLKKNKSESFFAWIHYMDAHYPFAPPKNFHNSNYLKINKAWRIYRKNPDKVSKSVLKEIVNLYDAEIRYADYAVGRVVKRLKELGIYDNTTIIITADHGDELFEHGNFNHGKTLYEEVIRVPLIIVDNSLPKNIRVSEPIGLIDIPPTILDLVSISPPENFQGRSLLPIILGRDENKRDGVISETLLKKEGGGVAYSFKNGLRLISYRTKKWKLILNEKTGNYELYDLENDPEEKVNLYEDKKEIAKKLEEKLIKHIRMENKSQKTALEKSKVKRVKNKLRKKLKPTK